MNDAPQQSPIERFGWFDTWLARGAEPSPAGLRWLKSQGVGIIVNLREHDGRRDAESAGLRYVHIPVKDDAPPETSQLVEWLALCKRVQHSQAIFVHCHGGEGRTSVFCAAVRIAQGADAETAICEQLPYGFRPQGEHAAQSEFLYAFARDARSGRLQITRLTGVSSAAVRR